MAVLERIGNETSVEESLDRLVKLRNRPRQARTKIIKAGSGATAAVAVGANFIDLSAPAKGDDEPLGVSVTEDGTVLRGKVGFTNQPSDISLAGMWSFNDLILSGAPSTIITPIPTTVFKPPLESLSRYIQSAAVIAVLAGLDNV